LLIVLDDQVAGSPTGDRLQRIAPQSPPRCIGGSFVLSDPLGDSVRVTERPLLAHRRRCHSIVWHGISLRTAPR
jgi:hypothetical protein